MACGGERSLQSLVAASRAVGKSELLQMQSS